MDILRTGLLTDAVGLALCPDEEKNVPAVRGGSETSRGVRFLKVGTVAGAVLGGKLPNEGIEVELTSILQIPPGRMILAHRKAVAGR